MIFGERFLEHPDLFPARRSGEAWGEDELLISCGGDRYRFAGLSSGQCSIICRHLEPHVRKDPDDGEIPIEIKVFRASRRDFRDTDRTGIPLTVDLDQVPSSVRIAGLDFVGRIDWSPTLGGALWTSLGNERMFLGVFENYLRVLAAYRLLEAGGALLHSAGVVDKNRAFLFIGPSGAGKSTIARLAHESGRVVLSDDLNALRRRGDELVVRKVPFSGELEFGSPEDSCYPLAALCHLRQGGGISVLETTEAISLASLIGSSPFVNGDPHRLGTLETNLRMAVDRCFTGSLTFPRKARFADILQAIEERR